MFDDSLVKDASVYQMSLRFFTPEGTLNAARKMLPFLSRLGPKYIQLVALMRADDDDDRRYWSKRQIASNSNNPKNSYRIKDYFTVDPEYGTNDDFKSFVKEAHRQGLRIVLDLVYLHCGPKANFLENHPEYVMRDQSGEFLIIGEWAFPRFDFSNPEVREYLWSNMVYWVRDFDVDGFRCDVGDAIPVDFWREGIRRVREIKHDVIMINEGEGNEYFEAFDVNYFYSGSFDAILVAKGITTAAQFRKKWEEYRVTMPENGRILHYIDNHDVTSDQGLNRNEIVLGTDGVDALLVLDFMLDGVPFIFNGYEVADELPHSMFTNRYYGTNTAINWANALCEKGRKRFNFMKMLFSLRRNHPALSTNKLEWLDNTVPEKIISFIRPYYNHSILTVINMTDESTEFEICNIPVSCVNVRELLSSNARVRIIDDTAKIQMNGFGYYVGEF